MTSSWLLAGTLANLTATTGISDSRLLANYWISWLAITSRVKSLYWQGIVLATLAILLMENRKVVNSSFY
ncbi:MAG: hypothetical protein HRT95_20315 [Moritella sp.]|uniref:hypothetical protein n=1 Tax=Moritella sp. TaxID=78556 RepID=UPI001D47E1AE|nr:hypothetical protein [Moritella sp.]NQZ52426.1 hypothetical protein [Moritella sp.]